MKTLPDKSIDCFVCDLPFGCLAVDWDVKIDLSEFWKQVERLMRNDHVPILHFCTTKFGFELYASKPSWFRYDLIWNKISGVGFLGVNKQPLRSHENIYVFSKKGTYYKRIDIEGDFPKSHSRGKAVIGSSQSYNGGKPLAVVERGDDSGRRCVKSIVSVERGGRKKDQHPTQKPVELYKWLLSRYCVEGGTMLDATAGSFNSCLAGKELGLNCIGIEKDDVFFEKARAKLGTL